MTLTMYDSTDVTHLPDGAPAYAGYVGGRWPTWGALRARFESKAHLLSIAVTADEHALCLDIEKGDATPAQAPAWVKMEHARNVARPVLYASASSMAAVMAHLHDAGIARTAVRLWSAHYGQGEHICGPSSCKLTPAMDGTQWRDDAPGAGGAKVDESLLLPDFFHAPPPEPDPITYAAVRLADGVTRLVISRDAGRTMA